MPSITQDIVDRALGYELEPLSYTYDERDVALYALGIGAPADWLDQDELKFVYELSGRGFEALPTFATIFAIGLNQKVLSGDFAGIKFNPMMLVHGEQYLEIVKPLPARAQVKTSLRISNIFDKGSGLLMVITGDSADEGGDLLARSRSSMFVRGLGGFGGDRGPSAGQERPQRAPDIVQEEKTRVTQALLYRLSGDPNPLHADPHMAAIGKFDKPILHGLCTYGFAGRAILKHCCHNRSSELRSINARFARHVFPGDTLRTEIWTQADGEILFQTKAKERNMVVLSNGMARLRE